MNPLVLQTGKLGDGQQRQGLKPGIFSIVYGPTKVVPWYKTELFRSPQSCPLRQNRVLTQALKALVCVIS
jgi:hypothetical protein